MSRRGLVAGAALWVACCASSLVGDGEGARRADATAQTTVPVRVTHYYWTGSPMHSGRYPYPGAAACSWNFPQGTVIAFRDGRVVTCEDRGHLGSWGWVDIYAASWWEGQQIEASYQYFVCCEPVRVLRWGW